MTKLFADRMFLTINGFEAMHVKSANIRRNQSLSRVETMTRNKRTAGYKRGNLGVQCSFELDIEAQKAQLDLALADPTADIGLVAECGGERYTVTGLAESSMDIRGSVGDASKSIECEALDIVNENGSSVNVDISLG
jgi:hypothetical protein